MKKRSRNTVWTNSSFRLVCSGLYEKQRQYLARFLKRGSYQAFADYLSNFCDAYTAAGLPVYAISPANEPEYAASWNSCLWLPGTTTLGPFIVNNLGPKLRQTHPETRIILARMPSGLPFWALSWAVKLCARHSEPES